jgi:hypothetical protein
MSNDEFITLVKQAVYENCFAGPIIPSILIAHAVVESKWGLSPIAVNANNLFGVQCNSGIDEDYFEVQEPIQTSNGQLIGMSSIRYRKYASWKGSIEDYIQFLMETVRFRTIIPSNPLDKNISLYAEATLSDKEEAKRFERQLAKIIRTYHLDQYDNIQYRHNPYSLAQVGDHGEIVKWMQYELRNAGYPMNDCIDLGYFDYHDMIMLRQYQSDHGIEPTGILDLKTFATLASFTRC